jgi:electron transfer flavoprotein beta subunit
VRRNVGNGWEILESRLPLLLTVLDTANEPRPAAAKRVMRFKRARSPGEIVGQVATALPNASAEEKKAEQSRRSQALDEVSLLIEQWDLDDIKADLQWCGMSGSPTKVHRVQSIVLTKEGFTPVEANETAVRQMVHELIKDHTLG